MDLAHHGDEIRNVLKRVLAENPIERSSGERPEAVHVKDNVDPRKWD
jgi:hypothetical protein